MEREADRCGFSTEDERIARACGVGKPRDGRTRAKCRELGHPSGFLQRWEDSVPKAPWTSKRGSLSGRLKTTTQSWSQAEE